uniref:Si:ch73-23l24.1 n=1 Tax=Cyprinus carpio carpio TaxID=630221 RepID=A0A8C0YBI5_CYPCA
LRVTSMLSLHLYITIYSMSFCFPYRGSGKPREKRSVPNWALTSSDFFAWIEELRSHAGYDKIEELARTFWAHFPSASRLGYDPPAPEE